MTSKTTRESASARLTKAINAPVAKPKTRSVTSPVQKPAAAVQPMNVSPAAGSSADRILAECAIAFSSNSDDCNKYLKAVAAKFFEPDLFTGPAMNADAIVAELQASTDWIRLGTSHVDAIRDAKAGRFVVAGMTSEELSSSHGHLAIVVGDDGKNSGSVLVPICYAGSLNPNARVERLGVSWTFGSRPARESRISYFSRTPDTVPSVSAISRLVDHLRGVRVEPEIVTSRERSVDERGGLL